MSRHRSKEEQERIHKRILHLRKTDPELTINIIAKRLGVLRDRVRDVCREAGLPFGPQPTGKAGQV